MERGAYYFEQEPFRSGLLEVMFGEMNNYNIRMFEYQTFQEHKPDTDAFTQQDVMDCQHFGDLPDDWQEYALACIDKYFLKGSTR